jgi:membrane protease YdiL (CAAX protease family)
MDSREHLKQVILMTAGELAFAVVALPLYALFVLPKYPQGALPGFWPVIADGVSPALGVLAAFAVLGVALAGAVLALRFLGADRFLVDEVNLLVDEFTVLDFIPIYLAAGIGEEFLFRVVFADVLGLAVSAVLFTAVHLAYWKKPLLLVYVFALGLLLGAFYLFTKSLLLCALVHAAYNILVSVFLKRGGLARG